MKPLLRTRPLARADVPTPTSTDTDPAKTTRTDAYTPSSGASGAPVRPSRFDRGLTSVLVSSLTVAVFAVHLGCQSPAGPGAPFADSGTAVEQPADASKPAEGHVVSPHGDFEALPPAKGPTTPAEGHVVSPSGDFEALPPAPRGGQ